MHKNLTDERKSKDTIPNKWVSKSTIPGSFASTKGITVVLYSSAY